MTDESRPYHEKTFSTWRLAAAFFAYLLVACSNSPVEAAADKPPNIVFMFADDLGYGDLGCYGHPYAKTPAMDQLAKEGTRFTQFYVTGVTCNPSRTGLMTGLFPARFPKYAADFGFGDRVTITELLKKRGYKTGHFGKWHIGPDSDRRDLRHRHGQTIGKSRDKIRRSRRRPVLGCDRLHPREQGRSVLRQRLGARDAFPRQHGGGVGR